MYVRSLSDIVGTERDIQEKTWNSRRLILSAEGVGFSLHDTMIHAGTETYMWYRHHVEAVYCIEGTGTVETVDDGRVYAIEPGTVYLLDGHEKHILRAETDMRMICVFNPPLTGRETHDEEGVYPLLTADAAGS